MPALFYPNAMLVLIGIATLTLIAQCQLTLADVLAPTCWEIQADE